MIQPRKKIKVARNCVFCKEKKEPHFREVAALVGFVSERGRIVGRDRSGVCASHQRRLTVELKRARHLALVPFVSGL